MPLNYATQLGMKEIAYLDFLMHPEQLSPGVKSNVKPVTDSVKLARMVNGHFGLKGIREVKPEHITGYLDKVRTIANYAQQTRRETSHLAVLLEWQRMKHIKSGTDRHDMNVADLTLCLNHALGYKGTSELTVDRVENYIDDIARIHEKKHETYPRISHHNRHTSEK